MNNQTKSHKLYNRAKEIILGGTQTISKQPESYDVELFPAFIERGEGSRLWDIDGNEYIDFVAALGPIILGYCHPTIDIAIQNQLTKGILFSGNSPLEVELAEKLTKIIPNAEKIRFFKSGAEATSAAVRLARNFTGRDKIMSCGYHGWHDWYIAQNHEPGIPKIFSEYIFSVPYGNIDVVRSVLADYGHEIACVIVEPVVLGANGEFLEELDYLTRKAGALLVFDEIITGFRIALGGAQEFFGIEADLAIFGKAMANGMPLSAVTGRNDVFEAAKDLWISTTYGGETLSLAASLATISELENSEHYLKTKFLGDTLITGWRDILKKYPNISVEIIEIDSMPLLLFSQSAKDQEDIFMREMLKQGILTRRNHYWFISGAHGEIDTTEALIATEIAFARIQERLFVSERIAY